MPALTIQTIETPMFAEEKPPLAHAKMDWQARPASTLAEAARLCRGLADDAGASGFGLFFLVAQGETKRLAPVFDASFPGVSPLTKLLSGRGAEGLARLASDSAAPLWWRPHDASPFLTAAARCWAIETDSPAPGTAGIAFPVSVERGRSGAIVFHGDDMVVDETALCELHARCFGLFGEVARQRTQDCAKTPPVSRREIECLRLTANGLTSEEIATALGLSVHTANQYLTNSTHKLNAVNRIHAVAKALRGGLID